MRAAKDLLRDMVMAAEKTVAFTGAGISTECGIPDFRSPGGLWTKNQPIQFDEFVASRAARDEAWRRKFAMEDKFRAARPGRGHRALARLVQQGKLSAVITQNIDNLHQRAGLPADRVIELHGNATRARCLTCAKPYERERVQEWLDAGVAVPVCDPPCGGLIKPHTIMFGEAMPRDALEEAERRARASDLFVVVGSSLVVYPAAYMPLHAKDAGAALAIVNLTETPHDDQADVLVRGSAAGVLTAVVDRLQPRPVAP